jgi:hypothetical protein
MNKIKNILTKKRAVLFVLFLFAGIIGFGVMTLVQEYVFTQQKSQVVDGCTPLELKTEVTIAGTVLVTWKTQKECYGFLVWGISPESMDHVHMHGGGLRKEQQHSSIIYPEFNQDMYAKIVIHGQTLFPEEPLYMSFAEIQKTKVLPPEGVPAPIILPITAPTEPQVAPVAPVPAQEGMQ